MATKLKKKVLFLFACISILAYGCRSGNSEADAYGNFEADEIIVSARSQGVLQSLGIDEGSNVEKDIIVGYIDSTDAWLKRGQLLAQLSVISSRIRNTDAQLQVQNEQRNNLQTEVDRLEKLLRDNAATRQQWDEITGRLRVLDSQIEATRTQKNIIQGEQNVLKTQLDEIDHMLEKCRISSPITGTVLEKYTNAGELVTPGKALFKVANLEEMILRVYVSGSQLASVKIGDSVNVRIDGPEGDLQHLPGVISWISSQVEFTPKIIQTREERVNMVYAVKIRVRNDGRLKIGMPGEAEWKQ